MIIKSFIALLLCFTSSVALGESFSCDYTKRPACLGYLDRVVDENYTCIKKSACITNGLVCKHEYDTLVDSYNELLKKHNSLVDNYRALLLEVK